MNLFKDASSYRKHIEISRSPQGRKACNKKFIELINSPGPFMIGRAGGTELVAMKTIDTYLQYNNIQKLKTCIRNKSLGLWTKKNFFHFYFNAGFFSINKRFLIMFFEEMKSAISELDLLGSGGTVLDIESYYFSGFKNLFISSSSNFEPFCINNPWTKHLENKKVLVIHPFAELIELQYKNRRDKLFRNKDVLPEFEICTIKAIQTSANNTDSRFKNWFEALDWMENTAMNKKFDIAIIGCGAYGFPLSARLKRNGKKAIHFAGGVQLLFGIKGKRWDERFTKEKIYNEFWIRPTNQQIPQNHNLIEGGCYW